MTSQVILLCSSTLCSRQAFPVYAIPRRQGQIRCWRFVAPSAGVHLQRSTCKNFCEEKVKILLLLPTATLFPCNILFLSSAAASISSILPGSGLDQNPGLTGSQATWLSYTGTGRKIFFFLSAISLWPQRRYGSFLYTNPQQFLMASEAKSSLTRIC